MTEVETLKNEFKEDILEFWNAMKLEINNAIPIAERISARMAEAAILGETDLISQMKRQIGAIGELHAARWTENTLDLVVLWVSKLFKYATMKI